LAALAVANVAMLLTIRRRRRHVRERLRARFGARGGGDAFRSSGSDSWPACGTPAGR
jgi:hypothetical protein